MQTRTRLSEDHSNVPLPHNRNSVSLLPTIGNDRVCVGVWVCVYLSASAESRKKKTA